MSRSWALGEGVAALVVHDRRSPRDWLSPPLNRWGSDRRLDRFRFERWAHWKPGKLAVKRPMMEIRLRVSF